MFSGRVSHKQLLNVLLGHLAAGRRGGFNRRRLGSGNRLSRFSGFSRFGMFSGRVSRKQLLNVLLGHLAAGWRGGFSRRRLVVYRSFRSVVLDYLGFIRIGIIIAAECRR